MQSPKPTRPRPNYGIDAPGAVRNMLIGGTLALIVSLVCFSGLVPKTDLTRALRRNGIAFAIGLLGMGGYMYGSSRFGKISEREWLLDLKPGVWRGDEAVLDVGCGLGVMLIGAARRLTTGTAVGIDIWQAQDLSGNSPEGALENARRERVAGRVAVATADMRHIPFPDGHFDVVVSNAAIHNLCRVADRAAAVSEIARVLKPGGACILADVRHGAEYAGVLRAHGVPELQRRDASITSLFFALVSLGNVRPFVLIARKPAASE